MNEPDNNELLTYIFAALAVCIGTCIFALIFKRFGFKTQKWLDAKIKEWPNKSKKKLELLEEEYRTYSTNDLLEVLKKIHTQRSLHNAAIFNVSRTRMEDERIRQRIQQLQSSIDILTRRNADYVMRDYFENQYTDCATEKLLDLLQSLENRNKQEITVILTIAATRMQNQRVNLCIEQLQNSKKRLVREQAKQIMKDYMA